MFGSGISQYSNGKAQLTTNAAALFVDLLLFVDYDSACGTMDVCEMKENNWKEWSYL